MKMDWLDCIFTKISFAKLFMKLVTWSICATLMANVLCFTTYELLICLLSSTGVRKIIIFREKYSLLSWKQIIWLFLDVSQDQNHQMSWITDNWIKMARIK
jgi:hypothetical protein